LFQISRKEKWDSSGANEAFGRINASIPQGTKDYLSTTTSTLFNRQSLRSVTVTFGIGEERPFYIEKSPALLASRVRHNVSFFYLNYMVVTAILFLLTVLISPTAILGIGILAVAWMYVIRQSSSGQLQIASVSISQTNATIGMGGLSVVVLFWLLSGIFWYALFSSGFLVLAHAVTRDASMHQDDKDAVDMVGEVGEDAAFLGNVGTPNNVV
jgi:hypothetical protein